MRQSTVGRNRNDKFVTIFFSRNGRDGGQLPISKRGNKYVLVLQCQATKWVHCIALRNLRADTVATNLIQFFAILGIPR